MTTGHDPVTAARDALLREARLLTGDERSRWSERDEAWWDAALDNLIALVRAEAGVSLEEMGKAWAAVEAALPEHRYFKVEHDSDDDPSWYLAVWRSDGIFPDPIRWAQADTLLDGLTRLALELRTPR